MAKYQIDYDIPSKPARKRQRFYYHLGRLMWYNEGEIERKSASVLQTTRKFLASEIVRYIRDAGGKVNVNKVEKVQLEDLE